MNCILEKKTYFCLGSILLPSDSTMELYFSNFKRVILSEHSFDHITQEHSSKLRITFDRFQHATFEHTSFFDLHQLDQSEFYLTLSNFYELNIEQTLFDTITQCKFIYFLFVNKNTFYFSKIFINIFNI